jgi:hypothetical protein
MAFERVSTSRGHRYLQLVESRWDPVKKQSRIHVLRHLGPVAEGRKGRPTARISIDGVEAACQAGHLAMFHHVASEFGIPGCLETACPSEDGRVADAILALVFNQLNGRQPLARVGPWLDSTPLGGWMGVSGESLTKDVLSSALDAVCSTDGEVTTKRVHAIQKLATDAWRSIVGPDPAHFYFYYDVTRVRYHGSACALAARGYGPVAGGRPHVGLGLVTSRGSHFPVLSLAVRGSANDAATFEGMAASLGAWDLKELTVILDRGILNSRSVAHARKAGFHVLGGCTETSKEVRAALRRWRDDEIERSTQVYPHPGGGELYYLAWEGSLFGQRGRLVLTLDPERRTKERGARDRMLHELRAGATRARARQLRRELGSLVVPSVGRRGWRIDEQAEAEARQADGRFLLFTTDMEVEPEEVVRAYFQRDEVEKAFRELNGGASLSPVRYRLPNHVEPYLTVVCHLAYLVRAAAAWKLREAKRPESVDQAIDALKAINEVTVSSKGRSIALWTRMTKQQEQLVKAFGLQDSFNSY